MFPIGDENERGHGPAYVTLAIIGLNVLVFLLLQGAGASQDGEEFTYGFSAVPYEIVNGVDLVDPQPITDRRRDRRQCHRNPARTRSG